MRRRLVDLANHPSDHAWTGKRIARPRPGCRRRTDLTPAPSCRCERQAAAGPGARTSSSSERPRLDLRLDPSSCVRSNGWNEPRLREPPDAQAVQFSTGAGGPVSPGADTRRSYFPPRRFAHVFGVRCRVRLALRPTIPAEARSTADGATHATRQRTNGDGIDCGAGFAGPLLFRPAALSKRGKKQGASDGVRHGTQEARPLRAPGGQRVASRPATSGRAREGRHGAPRRRGRPATRLALWAWTNPSTSTRSCRMRWGCGRTRTGAPRERFNPRAH
jgi:hypothetical protein